MLWQSVMSAWVCCELWPFIGTTVSAHPWTLNTDIATNRLIDVDFFMMISG
jgi:hypothetical protein